MGCVCVLCFCNLLRLYCASRKYGSCMMADSMLFYKIVGVKLLVTYVMFYMQ